MSFDLSQYEVTKNVTRDFFMIPDDGSPMYLKFESPFIVDPTIEVKMRRGKNNDDKKEPMEIADVINLQTGELGRLIGNEVVKSELRTQYPNDSYVGKVFEFKQGSQKTGRGGNKYRTFKIAELRPKGAASEPAKGARK